MQRARRGIRSRLSRITPWAAGGAKPLRHLGCPKTIFLPEESGVHAGLQNQEVVSSATGNLPLPAGS
ncbi:hypothetical protein VULLAG_LOCUS15153 [Vulpes lagopus]